MKNQLNFLSDVVPASAFRKIGPIPLHREAAADEVQGQNPDTPDQPGHASGGHLSSGQRESLFS